MTEITDTFLKQAIIGEYEESPTQLPSDAELNQIVFEVFDTVNDVAQEFYNRDLSVDDIVREIVNLAFEHIDSGLVKLTDDNRVTGIVEMIRYAAAETAVDYVVRNREYNIRYEDFSLRFDTEKVVIQYYCAYKEEHEYLEARLSDLDNIYYEDDYFGYMAE